VREWFTLALLIGSPPFRSLFVRLPEHLLPPASATSASASASAAALAMTRGGGWYVPRRGAHNERWEYESVLRSVLERRPHHYAYSEQTLAQLCAK
jgi:hypothetical protein